MWEDKHHHIQNVHRQMIYSSHSQILIKINVHISMTKDVQAYLNIQTPHIITQFADS